MAQMHTYLKHTAKLTGLARRAAKRPIIRRCGGAAEMQRLSVRLTPQDNYKHGFKEDWHNQNLCLLQGIWRTPVEEGALVRWKQRFNVWQIYCAGDWKKKMMLDLWALMGPANFQTVFLLRSISINNKSFVVATKCESGIKGCNELYNTTYLPCLIL